MEGCQPKFPDPMPHEPSDRDKIAPKLRKALRACTAGEEPWPLFVYGPAGTGKSCAALRAFRCFGGWFVKLAMLCGLFNDAREGRLRYSSGYERTITDLKSGLLLSHIVVLDDVGVREKRYDVFNDVLDCRWERNPPLIVTSNMTPKVLAVQYDDRIVSRLTRSTVVKLTGSDRRLERKE